MDEKREDVYARLTVEETEALKKERNFPEDFLEIINRGIEAVKQGVNRVHILDGRMKHVLLIEFFSVKGAGTIIIQDESRLYEHELDKKVLEEEVPFSEEV